LKANTDIHKFPGQLIQKDVPSAAGGILSELIKRKPGQPAISMMISWLNVEDIKMNQIEKLFENLVPEFKNTAEIKNWLLEDFRQHVKKVFKKQVKARFNFEIYDVLECYMVTALESGIEVYEKLKARMEGSDV
jgi:hypothetical protein